MTFVTLQNPSQLLCVFLPFSFPVDIIFLYISLHPSSNVVAFTVILVLVPGNLRSSPIDLGTKHKLTL